MPSHSVEFLCVQKLVPVSLAPRQQPKGVPIDASPARTIGITQVCSLGWKICLYIAYEYSYLYVSGSSDEVDILGPESDKSRVGWGTFNPENITAFKFDHLFYREFCLLRSCFFLTIPIVFLTNPFSLCRFHVSAHSASCLMNAIAY